MITMECGHDSFHADSVLRCAGCDEEDQDKIETLEEQLRVAREGLEKISSSLHRDGCPYIWSELGRECDCEAPKLATETLVKMGEIK